ncbi:RNA polymerase I specific transcription initiation factor Rrn7, putative [Talaromyces stipitatus ATCC 10500]|uniref:RNA polymerase I specific transcription initiation factor Rrn7, putative n=1 Tax=Talaromyces stipitatus (strain ATCC 10500 / CBS 375.48 / QM 6759 / NRRL 1006) TaxID=441959 RepID=B8MGI0_TALSN|nr:RNA polymerase I specific transcription initiation factor Rrn7, putative [Talaromyces stipitatus ATCC 10500]EED16731.1 RNA polymerase I specific transcription initiation factor Rrn7, putative [Talaromyces stipitatus ATCC 10500]
MEYIKRGPCGQDGCRETRYYLDNGIWFCRRGHQQEGRQVEEDPDDYNKRGTVHRIKKAAVEKIQKTYTGRQGYRLFIFAYQLILWKQCQALITQKGFPADIEKLVKDLWALRLENLTDRFDLSLDEPRGDDGSDGGVFSSQTPAASIEKKDATHISARKSTDSPLLRETLGLLYLACLLLRLPVSIGDIYKYAVRNEIPFIRALKSVPQEMRDRLSPQHTRGLSVQVMPESDDIHETVNLMVAMYKREYNIVFPPLNMPLMLFQFIRKLALPLEVYTVVRRLQQLLQFRFTFSSGKKWTLKAENYPEAQLLGLIIVATKLIFPFSKTKGFPTVLTEPAAQLIDWNLWAAAQKKFESLDKVPGRLAKGDEINVNEGNVFHMTENQLDDYLDWYQNTWLDQKKDLFPLKPSETDNRPDLKTGAEVEEAIDKKVREMTASIRLSKIIPDDRAQETKETDIDQSSENEEEKTPRPGYSYRIYRTESDLPKTARKFYQAAADLAGLSLKTLVLAVNRIEGKLENFQYDLRRAEEHGEDVWNHE